MAKAKKKTRMTPYEGTLYNATKDALIEECINLNAKLAAKAAELRDAQMDIRSNRSAELSRIGQVLADNGLDYEFPLGSSAEGLVMRIVTSLRAGRMERDGLRLLARRIAEDKARRQRQTGDKEAMDEANRYIAQVAGSDY